VSSLQEARVAADDIASALARLHPSVADGGVSVGAAAIDPADEARLLPQEAAIVASAVAKRRREFASGRSLLRRLLDTDEAVTVLATRAPQLPSGVVASLAHDDEIVVAAVSRAPSVRALGIDLEPVGAVDGEVADAVRRPEERDLDPTWVFVAKEAMYKAWSSQGGRFLRHEDVSVTDTGSGSFVATVLADARSFIGSSTVVGGRVVALVVVIGHDEG
jgi:4'-phosphopantetheinyl transferase EntD